MEYFEATVELQNLQTLAFPNLLPRESSANNYFKILYAKSCSIHIHVDRKIYGCSGGRRAPRTLASLF